MLAGAVLTVILRDYATSWIAFWPRKGGDIGLAAAASLPRYDDLRAMVTNAR
jgi:hypothetical protein